MPCVWFSASASRVNQNDRGFAGVSMPRFQRNLLQRGHDGGRDAICRAAVLIESR